MGAPTARKYNDSRVSGGNICLLRPGFRVEEMDEGDHAAEEHGGPECTGLHSRPALIAAESNFPCCPGKIDPVQLLSGSGFHYPRGFVVAECRDPLAIRTKGHRRHSGLCRGLESNAAIFSMHVRTSLQRAAVLTFSGLWSSPWMILPKLISRPVASESTNESKASSNLSSSLSLFVKMKRMGMNCIGLPRPSDRARSTAWTSDSRSQVFIRARTAKLIARRHLAAFSFSGGGEAATSFLAVSERSRSIEPGGRTRFVISPIPRKRYLKLPRRLPGASTWSNILEML